MTPREFALRAACVAAGVAFALGALPATSLAGQKSPVHRPAAAPAKSAKSATVVRAQIVSGTPQSAHAYVAPAAAKYVTEFTRPLVVRVSGGKNPKLGVRFFCITAGCELPPQVQPDEVKRIDPRTFEAQSKDGQATISLTISTDTPRTVEIVAEPVVANGERAVRSAPFRLSAE